MKEQPDPFVAREIRFGNIRAKIWEHGGTCLGATYTVTFEQYCWNGTASQNFDPENLLLLAKVADEAHSRIHYWQRDADE